MICPKCGRQTAADRDFCEHCPAYLRWDESAEEADTAILTPVDPPQDAGASWDEPSLAAPPAADAWAGSAPPPADVTPTEAVVVTLRLPGDDTAAGETTTVNVDAGGQAMLVGLVGNKSGFTDTYYLSVEGLREGWWTIAPASVSLVPFGSADGAYEQEVTIRLHPPRAPQARAGQWPIKLVATSRTQGTQVASASAMLVIAPYEAFESRIRPERVRGKRNARLAVPVRNIGNAELAVRLRGEDADEEVNFAFEPRQLGIAPEGEASSRVTVSARRPLIGPERERRLSVFVEGPTQTLSGAAVFIQRPWLTRKLLLVWRIALTLLAAGLLVGGAFLAWTDQNGGLTGVCLTADADRCMRYDMYLDLAGYVDAEEVAPTPDTIPPGLDRPFNLATSLGFVTIVLGIFALVGARSGTLTWLSGAVALVALVGYFITLGDTSGTGAWVALAGGVCALAAGIIAAASRSWTP